MWYGRCKKDAETVLTVSKVHDKLKTGVAAVLSREKRAPWSQHCMLYALELGWPMVTY